MKKLTASHFLVDLSCALLIATISSNNMLLLVLLYNFCAFALELPLGVVLEDKFPPLKVASVGMAMVAFSWVFLKLPLLALIIAGTGNALFHLGGGLSVMKSQPNAAPLGVFIAPGAAGVFLGAFLGTAWIVPTVLFIISLLILLWQTDEEYKACEIKVGILQGSTLTVLALFFVVVLRGFSGIAQIFPWKAEFSVLFVLAVILGKAMGGYLSDHFGAVITGVVSLLVAAVCLAFPASPALGLIGIFAFQLTMPITLWLLSKITPKGLAFGLLTFGLFIGSLPILLNLNCNIPLFAFVIVSLLLFILGSKKEWTR